MRMYNSQIAKVMFFVPCCYLMYNSHEKTKFVNNKPVTSENHTYCTTEHGESLEIPYLTT